MSHPFSTDEFAKNLRHTIVDISVQIGHATNVQGRARAGYYRNAILLTAACVEAVLYEYIQKACQKDASLLGKAKRFHKSRGITTLIPLNKTALGTHKELWICEIDRTKIDRMNSFKDMNDFALELGLIKPKLHEALEYVRTKRNEIHIQTLTSAARQYNNQMLERVSGVLVKVMDKIEAL